MAEDNDLFSGLSQENLQNAERIRDTVSEIQKQFKRVNDTAEQTSSDFKQVKERLDLIGKGANKVAELQQNITNSTKATSDAVKQANKQRGISAQLQARIDNLLDQAAVSSGKVAENLVKKAKLLFDAKEQANDMAISFDKIAEDSASLDKSAGFFNTLSSVAEDIPGLRKFATPFMDASKAAKETALNNAKTGKNMSTLISGSKAFSKSLGAAAKAFLPLLLINSVVKAFKFVAELFVAADQNATQIGKNLGISKANAEGIRQEFVRIAASSSNILATSKALLEAQKDLVDFSGAVTLQSFKQADAQVLLTKNLGIAGNNAAQFQALLGASNNTLGDVIESTRVLTDEQFASNGFFISNQEILKEIANTSAEIAGFYGFSADNIARAAFQTRRFGLSLQQAKNISEGLLNFEQSISSELELELLSGRQFNLERARSLALTGDLAGATEQVMMEMSKLTEQQRQNPILMRTFSQLTGLSADELNRAYLVQTNLNQSTKEYVRQLRGKGQLERAQIAEELGLQGLTQEQIEKNLSAQDKFNAALEKAKDQFSGLVDSGALDRFANLLIDFVNKASRIGIFRAIVSGPGTLTKTGDLAQQALGSSEELDSRLKKDREGVVKDLALALDKSQVGGNLDQAAIDMLARNYGSTLVEAALQKIIKITASSENKYIKERSEAFRQYGVGGKTINADDFTIRTNPKDTLVMAGGTKIGNSEETNLLLKELISAVKEGKTINLDGRRVNEGLFLATSKFDRR